MQNKIIITGGLGFIGSNFIRRILKSKSNQILNIDKVSSVSINKKLLNFESSKNYSFAKCDLKNFNKLENIIKNFKPTTVINFAAESHVDNSILNPKAFINSNILGTFNILTILNNIWKKNIYSNKFIHISTDEVYGSLKTKEKPFTENSKFKPNNPYSASKAASDHLCRSYFKTFKLPILITHCSNNYGPKQHNEKLIPKVIECILKKKPIPVYGSGKNVRDWIYVADHCRALKLVLNKGRPGETYDIGTNNEISNNTLVKMICKIMQKKIPSKLVYKKLINYVPDRKGHDFRYSINSEKIKKTLNFKTLTSFEKGLEKTISWHINNFE